MSDQFELMINGEKRLFAKEMTIADLLHDLSLNPKQVAVEVNLELVPRESHFAHALQSGDSIEVHTLVGGG